VDPQLLAHAQLKAQQIKRPVDGSQHGDPRRRPGGGPPTIGSLVNARQHLETAGRGVGPGRRADAQEEPIPGASRQPQEHPHHRFAQ
jgi:hypothetical protein